MATRPGVASDTRELAEGDPVTDPDRVVTAAPLDGGAPPSFAPASGGPPALAPTSGRPRISTVAEPLRVPVSWLDRLLSLSHELPHDQGERAVVAGVIAAVQRLLPEVRVAVRPPSIEPSRPSERHMLWTVPPQSDEQARSGRLFPGSSFERSVSFPGGPAAGSLHFASEQDLFGAETSSHVQFMERAALVTAQALARAHTEDRARIREADVRTLKAQMVQAEKLASLGQIAAGMVHELNNPLTSIAAYTDFLLRRAVTRGNTDGTGIPSLAGDADDVERLRRIAESANRMLRFTRDLVSYARPSGEVPIAVQIHPVIARALAFCEHEMAGAGEVVERSYAEQVAQLRSLRGLPEQLAQVFVNLVTNACHAMMRVPALDSGLPPPASAVVPAESGEVPIGSSPLQAVDGGGPPSWGSSPGGREQRPAVLTISTSLVDGGDRVMIVLADTGSGITKANLPLVFAPFFTTKQAGRGTGLGLSIVKNIIESHRGEIRAESDPGVGTRFTIYLPIDPG